MAKKKLKLDKDSVNKFFIDHGEKFLFGLAIGLIALFVWLGLKTPNFSETTPQALYENASVRAKNHINNSNSWDKIAQFRYCDPEPAERIRQNSGMLNPDDYIYGSLCGTINATASLREDPQFIPVTALQTEFIRTQVATKAPDKGARERLLMDRLNALSDASVNLGGMRSWMFAYRPDRNGLSQQQHLALTYEIVAGIALVPYEEQVKLYKDKLKNSVAWHGMRDRPKYMFLQVQRSDDGGQTWVDMNKRIQDFYQRYFAKSAAEVISDEYVVDNITLPIPPVLNMDYREIAGHSSTPFASLYEEEKSKDEEEISDDDRHSMFRPDPAETDESGQEETMETEKIKTRLARFYDPTPKEVGKTYQYRVRVWVEDPNLVVATETIATKKRGGDKKLAELDASGGGGEAEADLMSDQGRPGSNNNRNNSGSKKNRISKEDQYWIDNPAVPLIETMLHENVRDRKKTAEYTYPEGFDESTFEDLIPTPWSEVSSVTIPQNYARFYTGSVNSPTILESRNGIEYSNEEYEPTANIVAITKAPNLDVSIPLLGEKIARGSILNFNKNATFLHPITWTAKVLNEFSDEEEDEDDPRRRRDPKGLFYQTDALVVDFMGGEKLPFSRSGDIFEMPSEVILMDSTGRLIVRSEIQDATNYRISTFQGDEAEPDAARKARKKKEEEDKKRDRGNQTGGLSGSQ